MQRNSNKARKNKDNSILASLESLSLSPHNHGNSHISSARRTSSSLSGTPGSPLCQITPPSYIKTTPPEILAHIFSFLDPEGFAAVSLVCKEWNSVAKDEYAWRAAFERFFGKHPFVPRLSKTWSGEYIHRSHLLRFELLTNEADF